MAISARKLGPNYPDLNVIPMVADFTGALKLPDSLRAQPKVAFFPGSTIGNLDNVDIIGLLTRTRHWSGILAFIIGIDLVKDPATLVAAYDDAAGVTAAFNLNLLRRLNREIGATFDLDSFAHEARWNASESRIEMHLVSRTAQVVQIGATEIFFVKGESVHTENSRKFARDGFAEIAEKSGWKLDAFLVGRCHIP